MWSCMPVAAQEKFQLWQYICYHSLMSYKVVVDTSVWISALIGPSGPAREVIRRALKKKLTPFMGNALFLEYEAVMKRKSIQAQCALKEDEQQELLAAFLSICRWVEIYYLWRPNLPDEGDNHLMELAIAGGASTILTENVRDFRQAQLEFPVKVMTPADFLKEERT